MGVPPHHPNVHAILSIKPIHFDHFVDAPLMETPQQLLNDYLVGGLVAMNFACSHSYWVSFIIPIDVHIFQKGSNHQPGI